MITTDKMVKDYYNILQIAPTANIAEIKAAYRKLASKYHPDKKPGDKYASARFFLIKEAYETLSKPSLKEEYLKRRWLNKANNQNFENDVTDPEKILKHFIHINEKIQTFDAFRVDRGGVKNELLKLLNDSNTVTLNDFNDLHINEEIIHQSLQAIKILNVYDQKIILNELRKIKATTHSLEGINATEIRIKQQVLFKRLLPAIILLLVLLLCTLIYIAGN